MKKKVILPYVYLLEHAEEEKVKQELLDAKRAAEIAEKARIAEEKRKAEEERLRLEELARLQDEQPDVDSRYN